MIVFRKHLRLRRSRPSRALRHTWRRIAAGLLLSGLSFLGASAALGVPSTSVRADPPVIPRSGTPSPQHPQWIWPVPRPVLVLREFQAPAARWSSGHRGLDIARESGVEVLAPAAGVVHFAGWVVNRPVLSVRHPGGYLSSYEPVTTELRAGDAVQRGQVIGLIADTPAHCPGGCLHFGVRLDGEYLSPRLLLGGLEPSILLPVRG